MKALGASNRASWRSSLGYGLLLGLIGCGSGHDSRRPDREQHHPIESFLTKMTGSQLFPKNIYYFDAIPRMSNRRTCS